MNIEEPKTQARIITRPAYKGNGDIYRTASTRWIGELYVKGIRIYTSNDTDTEGSAYLSVVLFIQRKINSGDNPLN